MAAPLNTTVTTYEVSPIKRARATKAEMERRAEFLIDYASEHGPITVRGLLLSVADRAEPDDLAKD